MLYKYNINSFSVENLGALKSAKIKLKPLTILCGGNNTGKTWLMYTIYGFIKNEISNLKNIDEIMNRVKKDGNYEFSITEWIKDNFDSFKDDVESLNKSRLKDIFNASENLFLETKFHWDVLLEDILENIRISEFESHLILGSKEDTFFLATKKAGDNIEMLSNKIPNDVLRQVISSAIYKSCNGVCKSNRKDVFLIPAERNGLHLFFRELSNRRTALLHHASRENFDLGSLLKDVLGSKYAKPIADYIDWLNEIPEIKSRNSKGSMPFHHIAEEIKKLIGGKYSINSDGSIDFTPKKPRNKPTPPKLDLHFSSSTIKSLFGIWFYLEYQAKENDTLMIDEPELNLHPSNQRLIARILAKLVNSGLNIILSTHSDYFIREINSLIMLSNTSGDKKIQGNLMKKYNISSDYLLSKEKIGAYVFKNSSVEEMSISNEGIIAETFDQEINFLNESSDDIYYSYVFPIINPTIKE